MSDTAIGGRKRSVEVELGNKRTSGITMTNEYSGYQPSAGVWQLTDRISPDVAPEEFFSEYVVKRRPAVFAGSLTDEEWKGRQWTVPYLFRKAGSTTVAVEDRPNAADSVPDVGSTFLEMHYREFISSLIAGETRYQLTNSDVQCSMSDLRDRSGFLSAVLQPLPTLAEDFPLRPVILGNLIPHQVALCQGHRYALTAPSSGLHHYFHDCLYTLVRGELRFRLFPPTAIALLRSSKCALKIHGNGLAVYLPTEKSKQKAACLRADGVPMIGVARMKRDHAEKDLIEAEARLLQLRNAGAEGNPEMAEELVQATTVLKNCEQLVDVASDELQRFFMLPDDDVVVTYRYYSDYDEDAEADSDVISIHDDDSEPEPSDEPAAKMSRLSDDVAMTTSDVADSDRQGDVPMMEYWQANSYDVQLAAENTDDADVLFAKCHQLRNVSCLNVELKPGEMLYLPASWLYEVTSIESGSTVSMPTTDVSSAASQVAHNSGDTDRREMMERGAADRDVVTDQSQLSAGNSDLMSTKASTGDDAVLLAAAGDDSTADCDSRSANKTESATDMDDVEPATADGGTASAPEMEGIPEAAGSDTAYQDENEASDGGTVSASGTTETVNTAKDINEHSDAGNGTDEVLVGNGDKTSEKSVSEYMTASGPASKSLENFTDDDSTDFLALTYLIHPPDGATFDQPYLDDFWKCRWSRMEAEIRRMLRKSSRLASDVITLDSSSSSSEYDSSDYAEEDSMASNSPIFVCEKRTSDAAQDSADGIVLDENSSNAIVVGDEDDRDDIDDEVDEIVCSGETNEADKDADSSIVVCDGETSMTGSSQLLSSTEAPDSRPTDTDLANCGSSVPEDSDPAATHDVSDICVGSRKMANGSADVLDPVEKTDTAASECEHVKDADVRNGTCDVDEAN